MKIRSIIVDDEPLARQGLETYAQQIEFLEIVAVCKNAIQANDILLKEEIDLLFLDIQMPQLTGIEFLKSRQHSPYVIFTTAYSEYALESYQFDVVDYLLKPISFERFLQAANKAQRFLSQKQEQSTVEAAMFIKVDQKLVKLRFADILFVESMQNYLVFHTADQKLMTLMTLKNALELLPSQDFVQVHKSYLVAKDKVQAIEGNLVLVHDHRIPISVRMRKEVMKFLVG